MAGNIENKYGTNNQAITCSLAPGGVGLASGSARASTALDNTSLLYQDALVFVQIKTAGSMASPNVVNVYAYGSADGGTTYSDGASGTDAAITLTSPPNMRLIGVVNAPTTATTYKAGPFSVAYAFNGVLPDHWGIVIENKTGAALDTTEGNHAKFYQGVMTQYT